MDGVRTGLVCVIDYPDPVFERLRRVHDPHAAAGVPAHLTCVAPFVPPRLVDRQVEDMLRTLASGVTPFTVSFPEVCEFPGVVWLHPEPEEPFRKLTKSIVTAFPDYPPYEGAITDPQPHMAVGMELALDEAANLRVVVDSEVMPRLPFRAAISSFSLLVLDQHGRRREEARFPFRV